MKSDIASFISHPQPLVILEAALSGRRTYELFLGYNEVGPDPQSF